MADWTVQVVDSRVVVRGIRFDHSMWREVYARIPASRVTFDGEEAASTCLVAPIAGSISSDSDSTRTGALVEFRGARVVHQVRRAVNAIAARSCLQAGKVLLHAVVAARGDCAVVLLGSHGAGKTTVGLQLKERGFDLLAGDTAIIDLKGRVHGGSRIILTRSKGRNSDRRKTELWLPQGESRFEAGWCHGGPYTDVETVSFALVKVGRAGDGLRRLGASVLAEALYRAGGYAFNRRVDGSPSNLRSFLDERARDRLMEHARGLSVTTAGLELTGDARWMADRLSAMTPGRA